MGGDQSMGVIWVMIIPSIIFTKIKTEFSSKLKEKYNMTDKNFSTVGSSDTPPVFPFVYIQSIEPIETGMDLEATNINGGIFSFQIDVTDNQSQYKAKEVMTEVLRIMKKMGFQCKPMPSFDDSVKDVKRMVARFQWAIDDNDIL